MYTTAYIVLTMSMNSIDSDHFVNFVFDRSRSQDREVKRQMGHGICDKCHRVVMVTKMGKFKHVGEPVDCESRVDDPR